MRIFDCSMFFNETLVSKVKLSENSRWIDETHITEADRTFKNQNKPYNFDDLPNSRLRYHHFVASRVFRSGFWNFRFGPWWANRRNCHWFNEAMQRNASTRFIYPDDNDIVIISDIDEILDSRRADELVWAAQKHGIVTVRLHLSHYFFDLFVEGWPGPENYSHRVFIMTGRHFRSLKCSPDQLRKAGEAGELVDKVHCLDGFAGFHHSWIGNVDTLMAKLAAYAHDTEDHDTSLLDAAGNIRHFAVLEFLDSQRCLFSGRNLYVQSDLPMLSAIDECSKYTSRFLLRNCDRLSLYKNEV